MPRKKKFVIVRLPDAHATTDEAARRRNGKMRRASRGQMYMHRSDVATVERSIWLRPPSRKELAAREAA